VTAIRPITGITIYIDVNTGNTYFTGTILDLIEIPTANLVFDHGELGESVSKQLRQ